MTEQVLINVDIERDDQDYNKLAQLKSALIGMKQEQAELSKAFKSGNITQKEYSTEVVRLEANMKKISATYTDVQRKVTGLKAPFADLKQAISDQAHQVNVAGISLTSFANPVTATIAVLGGLFTAYKNSVIGAKDLEYATNQLSSATSILGDQFALLFSGTKDGEGFFSRLANGVLNQLDPALAATSNYVAQLKEELEDLGRELLAVQGDNNERLAENQELMTKVQDSQTSYNEKIHLTGEMIANLRKNEEELARVKGEELKKLQQLLGTRKEDEVLQGQVLQKEKELSRVHSDAERKVNAILRLESNLTDEYNKQAIAKANARKATPAGKVSSDLSIETPTSMAGIDLDASTNAELANIAMVNEAMKESTETQDEELQKQSANKEKALQKDAAFMLSIFQESSQIFATELQKTNDIGLAIVKGYLKTLMNAFKRYIQFKLFGEVMSSPQSILSLGVGGLIQYAAMNALIEAAFAGADSVISGFASGGKVRGGYPVRRGNGDNVLITAKTNEVILTEQQQAALGGDETFRRLGVPGFATGGRVTTGAIPGGFSQAQVNQIINAISRTKIAVVMEDVEALARQRAQIVERANLF